MQHGTQYYTTFKLRFKMVEIFNPYEAQVQNLYVILTQTVRSNGIAVTRVKTHKLLQVCKQVVTSLFTSC